MLKTEAISFSSFSVYPHSTCFIAWLIVASWKPKSGRHGISGNPQSSVASQGEVSQGRLISLAEVQKRSTTITKGWEAVIFIDVLWVI
jgi:hypothetical protein